MRSEDVAAIFQALNDANARYLIVGGIGVNAHGYACATVHADIVLELEHSNVLRAMNALGAIGYRPLAPVKAQDFADPAKRQSWIAEKNMIVFQMRNPDRESTRLDIFVKEPFRFSAAYERALWEDVRGVRAPIAPYEELLQLKRDSGRPQDLIDIENLDTIRRERST